MVDMYEMHSCNDVMGDAKEAFDAAVEVYNTAFDSYEYSEEVLDGTKAATDDIDDKELREGMMEFSTFINKESMTLKDTIDECETLMDECEAKMDATPEDTLDYEVISALEEAKDAMMTCVKAMKEQ